MKAHAVRGVTHAYAPRQCYCRRHQGKGGSRRLVTFVGRIFYEKVSEK